MQYLKTYEKGETSKTVQHFKINEMNYNSARNALREMYDNKRLIVRKLIEKIHELPMVENESASKLRQIYNVVRECKESIKTMGIDTTSWDPIITYIMVKKWYLRTNDPSIDVKS